MKKIIFIILIVLVFIIIFAKISQHNVLNDDLIIAAVTMKGKNKIIGDDMLSGIQMYINSFNRKGGINGRKIVLNTYDDSGDIKKAINVAMNISKDNKTLLVLGHYFSSTSFAAGKVYMKSKIPAITGSATAENVTQKNDWYFSISPNNHFQGEYIASYIRSSLKYKNCCIIYETDNYGSSLYKNFTNKARRIGLNINKVWAIDSKNPDMKNQMISAQKYFKVEKDSEIIFLATHARLGADIIKALKHPKSKYKFIGADSFSTNAFIDHLSSFANEKKTPGYYSNGIYTTSPFLADFTNDRNQKFVSEYMKLFQKKPTWISACYYDATHMAVKALKKLKKTNIRHLRRTIRKELASHFSLETSEKGVCGPLFFDEDRNVKFPLRFCSYKNQHLVSDYFQYNIISQSKDTAKEFKKILSHDLIASGNNLMNKTRIVFTGISVNKITNLNINKGTYDMDFLLWFRFKGNFDDKNFECLNAVYPLKNKKQIAEYKDNDIKTRVYHLKGSFVSDIDLQTYPFEVHDLSIQIRHLKDNVDKLVYISENTKISYLNHLLNLNHKAYIRSMPEWSVKNTFLYSGIVSFDSSLGIPVDFNLKRPIAFSTCTASVRVKRTHLTSSIELLIPAFMLCFVLIISCLLPFRYHLSFYMPLLSILIVLTILLLYSFTFFQLHYLLLIQYFYLSMMVAVALGLFTYTMILLLNVKKTYQKACLIASRLLIFLIIFSVLFYAYHSYEPQDMKKIIHLYQEPQNKVDRSSTQ